MLIFVGHKSKEIMKTVKEVLSENRDSIISEIKWTFKVYRAGDIKVKMLEFLSYAESIEEDIIAATNVKNTKTLLRGFVRNMAYVQAASLPREKKEPISEIMGKLAEMEKANGKAWNPVTREWESK